MSGSLIPIQNDHQISHRGVHGFQSLLTQSKNRTPLPILPPPEREPNYESREKDLSASIKRP